MSRYKAFITFYRIRAYFWKLPHAVYWLCYKTGLIIELECYIKGGMGTKPTAAPRGRPTKFKPEYYELARNYCLLGATNADMAKYFNVSMECFNWWISHDPLFLQILKEGREQADAVVASRSYARACGFERVEKEQVLVGTQVVEIERTKYYPPETTAAIFWLCNRHPDKWRRGEKQEVVESTADQAKAVHSLLTALFNTKSD